VSARFDKFMIHVDIGTDEKLADFTHAERLCHIAGVLALAAKSPVRGCLIVGDLEATPSHIAKRAGVPLGVAKSTLKKLTEAGILIADDDLGCLRVHNWERFNPSPKQDTGNAARQARWRKRQADRNAESNALRNAPSDASNADEGEGEVEGTAFPDSGLALQGGEPDFALGDPGPEEGSNVVDFRDPKTWDQRGVA
jgi:hypothetical protein